MNMGALVWGIGGGFIIYFLTCNFLTLLLKPSWDEPIQTISDLLERDMGLLLWPRHDWFLADLKKTRVDEYIKESFMIKKLLKFLFLFPAILEDCYLRQLGHNKPEDTGKLI